MITWKDIWTNKGKNHAWTYEDVVDMNGFNDTGITVESYKQFWKHVKDTFNMDESSSFYEIGCGAGLSLKILKDEFGHDVGGCDYSPTSTIVSKSWDVSNDIECIEAHELTSNKKYDYIVSFSVFHYFPTLDYVQNVLKIMLEKSTKGIGIFDVCDEEKKDVYVEIRKKNDPNYEERYSGLNHLFIHKNFWKLFAEENDLDIIIEDQHITNYTNNKLRYNIYLIK